MRKEQILHALRLGLIVLLLVSAGLLIRETGYYSRLFERKPGDPAETEESAALRPGLSAAELARAVRPRTVLVRGSDGTASASAYAGEETEEAFRRFSATLGEALGSAGEPERTDEDAFRAVLDGECVYVDFFGEVPLGVLAQWLGSEMHGGASDVSARMLCLSLSDAAVQLCCRGSDGAFYRCETASVSETLRAKMSDFPGVEARFAYAEPKLGVREPYTVLLSEMPEIACVAVESVRGGIDIAELLQTVEMNSYLASSYVEADGTKVFIDDEKSLRLGPDGTVSFRTGSAEGERQFGDGVGAAVSYAYETALRCVGGCAGDAELILTGVSDNGGDDYTVTFDYCIGCIPLRLASGSAVLLRVRDGRLVQLQSVLRTYTRTGETERVLPVRQAAAVAGAAGTTPALIYADSGDRVACVWVKD